jgi:predicted anti-sigma-YlaC factor YlaD
MSAAWWPSIMGTIVGLLITITILLAGHVIRHWED